jgi:nucleoside-diphosphate-sugar epimerase
MRVAIAGAHGQVARLLTTQLAQRGDQVLGLIRNPDHAGDIRADGGEPVVCDLEHAPVAEVRDAVAGCQAVVFAAGAGAGSGAARKWTMDRDGAIKLIEATADPAARYVMVSAVGAEDPPPGDEVFAVYLQAKAQADAALAQTAREWIILRPGRLTDDPPAGRVRLDDQPSRGEIPRADVAAVIAGLLLPGAPARRTLYLNAGDTAIDDALGGL